MRRILVSALALFSASLLHAADGMWQIDRATLTYHVSHPLHEVDGVSHEVRGKGVCQANQCQFLVAAPVKSFDSGDSNRDLHMLQVTRGGEFPLVSVRTTLPADATSGATIHADVEVQFAGQTVTYRQVAFEETRKGNEVHITGTIPATISDFKIDPPKLLTIAVKNEIPVKVDLEWHFTAK